MSPTRVISLDEFEPFTASEAEWERILSSREYMEWAEEARLAVPLDEAEVAALYEAEHRERFGHDYDSGQ